jgi:hypothetical protein
MKEIDKKRYFLAHVRSTARHALHLQYDFSINALEIRAVQSPKSDVLLYIII